jgi:hypothetical protein
MFVLYVTDFFDAGVAVHFTSYSVNDQMQGVVVLKSQRQGRE